MEQQKQEVKKPSKEEAFEKLKKILSTTPKNLQQFMNSVLMSSFAARNLAVNFSPEESYRVKFLIEQAVEALDDAALKLRLELKREVKTQETSDGNAGKPTDSTPTSKPASGDGSPSNIEA